MFVVNRSDHQLPVRMVNPKTKQETTIFVQPKSKVRVQEGQEVHPEFLAMNKKFISVVQTAKPQSPTAPSVDKTSAPMADTKSTKK